MNIRDLQIAFLTTRRNRRFFHGIGPVVSRGSFSSYDQMDNEWKQKLCRFESQYMIVFIEDMKLKLAGQEFLPLKPEFAQRLIKDQRLAQVVFTLDTEGFNGLSTRMDKELNDEQFLRYWQINLPSSASGNNYIFEQVTEYRLQYTNWLKEFLCL